jgi:4-hydroxy-tetrahydrodipicolinate synthase
MIEASPIRGLWCATLTPLGPEGAIDHARMAAHVRTLFAQGVDGVAPFGTTGEGPSFSVAHSSFPAPAARLFPTPSH